MMNVFQLPIPTSATSTGHAAVRLLQMPDRRPHLVMKWSRNADTGRLEAQWRPEAPADIGAETGTFGSCDCEPSSMPWQDDRVRLHT